VTASTFAPVKAALVTELAAGVAGLQTFYGPPTGVLGEAVLSVGKAEGVLDDRDESGHPLPFGTFEERYTVALTLSVSLPTTDTQTLEAALFGYYDQIRAVIIADPTLGGVANVEEVLPLGDIKQDEKATGDGRIAWIDFDVKAVARV